MEVVHHQIEVCHHRIEEEAECHQDEVCLQVECHQIEVAQEDHQAKEVQACLHKTDHQADRVAHQVKVHQAKVHQEANQEQATYSATTTLSEGEHINRINQLVNIKNSMHSFT